MNGMTRIVLVATQVLLVLGCQGMPSGTRNGTVKELVIRENVSPVELHVKVGDEIRWINTSSASIHIVFPVHIIGKISCRRNFTGFLSGGIETTLGPDDSASLCFRESIYSTYLVRTTAVEGIEVNVTGAIQVGESSKRPVAEAIPLNTDRQTSP